MIKLRQQYSKEPILLNKLQIKRSVKSVLDYTQQILQIWYLRSEKSKNLLYRTKQLNMISQKSNSTGRKLKISHRFAKRHQIKWLHPREFCQKDL